LVPVIYLGVSGQCSHTIPIDVDVKELTWFDYCKLIRAWTYM